MHWLSLTSAWFGLAALLIIAMYILKKRYEPKRISSHLLWRQVLQEQEANRPWQRLKQQLLLWLQLMILLLIVIALMEPAVERKLAEDTHAVILLDRSASMATSIDTDGKTYLDTAKHELISWLDKEWGGGEVTLIVNGEYPQILANQSNQKQELVRIIEDIDPYYGTTDDETALSLARALASSSEQSMIHYFVDERYNINQEIIQAEENSLEVWHMYASPAAAEDERIRSFTLSQEERAVRGFATVMHAPQEQRELELTITAYNEQGRKLSDKSYKQSAAASGVTTFQMYDLPQGHYYMARLTPHDQDPNPYNNKQYGLIAEERVYEALLISDGNLFLEKALQLMNVGVTKLAPTSAVPSQELLSTVHFIITDGSYEKLTKDNAWKDVLDRFPLWIVDHPAADQQAKLVHAEPVVNEHEVTQYFTMDDIFISSIRELSAEELAPHDVLVQYGGAAAILAGTHNQKPLLRYTFALQDSDLPLRAVFPLLVMNSVDYLVSGSSKQLGSMLANAIPTLSMSADTSASYWHRLDEEPSDEKISETAVEDGYVTAPSVPGVYSLIELNEKGDTVQQRTAVITADATEFATASIAELISGSSNAEEPNVQSEGRGMSKLTAWLAACLMLLLLLEWEVYRRGI